MGFSSREKCQKISILINKRSDEDDLRVYACVEGLDEDDLVTNWKEVEKHKINDFI